ncbi:unnamed protein product [Gordionus sp. m RMFG-2023]|uniref:phospholipase DDHD2-like isoform X2 n=1 Tax=Gordionus sp. m RMFG-2023 TaxID=3053472 RepID=UPI0030DF8D29
MYMFNKYDDIVLTYIDENDGKNTDVIEKDDNLIKSLKCDPKYRRRYSKFYNSIMTTSNKDVDDISHNNNSMTHISNYLQDKKNASNKNIQNSKENKSLKHHKVRRKSNIESIVNFSKEIQFNKSNIFPKDDLSSKNLESINFINDINSSNSPPPILSASAFPSREDLATTSSTNSAIYKPVEPHWFYQKKCLDPQAQSAAKLRRLKIASLISDNNTPLDQTNLNVPNITDDKNDANDSNTLCDDKGYTWEPFSLYDSIKIEHKYRYFTSNPQTNLKNKNLYTVHTDGGRYDVDLLRLQKKAVYWTETYDNTDSGIKANQDQFLDSDLGNRLNRDDQNDAACCEVRRCTWFYVDAAAGDNKYIPYSNHLAEKLEEEYRRGIQSDSWNRRIDLEPFKECIIMHDPKHMVHLKPMLRKDEWGAVFDGKTSSLIVKRGVEDYDRIKEDEMPRIDHVIFVIHGIGEYCDFKFRTINQCVDGMRDMSANLLKSHFKQYLEKGLIGRVEFIPCNWHKILHSESTGVDSRLQSITLSSIKKLRDYTNDTLVDILFYTSPIYCQTIIDTVGNELNRLYQLFMDRNPGFDGTVSVIGHSLGSLIAFDLLSHQTARSKFSEESLDDSKIDYKTDQEKRPSFTIGDEATEVQSLDGTSSDLIILPKKSLIVQPQSENPGNTGYLQQEKPVNLNDFLKNDLNLDQEWIAILERERMDFEALLLCDDNDLKALGIPLGPRLKILKHVTRHPSYSRKVRQKYTSAPKLSIENSILSRAGLAGTGQPYVTYDRLAFEPVCFFAMGSPIGLFLTIRGIELIGEKYSLPTCPHFYNIFHPYDPVAFRIEPLILPFPKLKPVLIPHHKGRKRMHIELRENLNKMRFDFKQSLYQTFKHTMDSLHHISFIGNNSIENQKSSTTLPISRVASVPPNTPTTLPVSRVASVPPTPSILDRLLKRGSVIRYSAESQSLVEPNDPWRGKGEEDTEERGVLNGLKRSIMGEGRTSRPSLQISDPTFIKELAERVRKHEHFKNNPLLLHSNLDNSTNNLIEEPSNEKYHSATNSLDISFENLIDHDDQSKENANSDSGMVRSYSEFTGKDALKSIANGSISSRTRENFSHYPEQPTPLTETEDPNIVMGNMNAGRRIDFALQEKPIEIFNEYIFALHSHVCYWESEDTILMILNELYSLKGDIHGSLQTTLFEEFREAFIPSLFAKK